MSAIKSTYERKTILDFTDKKITKNYILKSLREANIIQTYYGGRGNGLTYIDNEIGVGMYHIHLSLNMIDGATKLREYGKFKISIKEGGKLINLSSDSRFKSQDWVKLNQNNKLKISDLINIIIYCKRLDNLKYFL